MQTGLSHEIREEDLLNHATQFHFGRRKLGQRSAQVTLIKRPDGWWLTAILGPMNPWHLGADFVWRYKVGSSFANPEVAIAALNRATEESRWDGFDYNVQKEVEIAQSVSEQIESALMDAMK